MIKKITSKQAAFYTLYEAFKTERGVYIPTWKFVGEIFVKGANRWVMRSYKCPTRLTDIFKENPNLLQREWVNGKSGAQYYEYRLNPNVSKEMIVDKKLFEFYKIIKRPSDHKKPN